MPLPMPDQAVIVLLTVNEHETHAVLDAFLGVGQVPEQQTRDGLIYFELGNHGGNRILHSVCEMGAGGGWVPRSSARAMQLNIGKPVR